MISIILSILLFSITFACIPMSLPQLFILLGLLLGTTAGINYYYRARPEDYEFSETDYVLSSEFSLFPIETDSAGRKTYIKRLFENGREYIQFNSTGYGQSWQNRQVPRSIVRYVYDNKPALYFFVAKGVFYPDLMQSLLPCKKIGVIIELHIPDSVAYYQS